MSNIDTIMERLASVEAALRLATIAEPLTPFDGRCVACEGEDATSQATGLMRCDGELVEVVTRPHPRGTVGNHPVLMPWTTALFVDNMIEGMWHYATEGAAHYGHALIMSALGLGAGCVDIEILERGIHAGPTM